MDGSQIAVLVAIFVVVLLAVNANRRRGSGDEVPRPPLADVDRPEPAISNESGLGPHRDLGRPFRVDHGDRPTDEP